MNKQNIEIEMERRDTTIAGLVQAMGDKGFEAIVTTEIISFFSEKPEEWVTNERKNKFENRFNEDVGTEHISYKVKSIKQIY